MFISCDGWEDTKLPEYTNEIIGHNIIIQDARGGTKHCCSVIALDLGLSFKLYTDHPNFSKLDYRGVRTVNFARGPVWGTGFGTFVFIYMEKHKE